MHANKPTPACLWLASMRNVAAEGLRATTAFFPICWVRWLTTFLAAEEHRSKSDSETLKKVTAWPLGPGFRKCVA